MVQDGTGTWTYAGAMCGVACLISSLAKLHLIRPLGLQLEAGWSFRIIVLYDRIGTLYLIDHDTSEWSRLRPTYQMYQMSFCKQC